MVAVGSHFPHRIFAVGLEEKNKLAEKNNEKTENIGLTQVSGSKVAYIQALF